MDKKSRVLQVRITETEYARLAHRAEKVGCGLSEYARMLLKEIENPTKEQIEEYLGKIGWSLRHHGCEHYYFYNHKKKCVGLCLLFPKTDARLVMEGKNWVNPSFTFYLKDVVMELLENGGVYDCVSFRGKTDKSIFILCPNYDNKKKSKTKSPTSKR